jgi:hypothetical protein
MSLIHTPEERAERIQQGLPYAVAPVEALRWFYDNATMPPDWLLAPYVAQLKFRDVAPPGHC